MKRREVSMPELLLGERDEFSGLSLITGPSGSGKSFLMDNAKFPEGMRILDLDQISAKQNDAWVTDLRKVKDADIAIGWSDNLVAVAKTLREEYEAGEPLTMYWIQPSPQIFRAANAAKAKDAPSHQGGWKATWAAKSKWPDSKVNAYLFAKMDMLLEKIQPEELVIVRNSDAKSPIVNGWHRPSGASPTTETELPTTPISKTRAAFIRATKKRGGES